MAIRRLACLWSLALLPFVLFAQQRAPTSALTPTQQEGLFMFRQRCLVCHVKPMIGNSKYGPRLSKEFIIGKEMFVRKQIMEGSERMPGFKYGLKADQVDAIVEYLKTVEKEPESKGRSESSSNADN